MELKNLKNEPPPQRREKGVTENLEGAASNLSQHDNAGDMTFQSEQYMKSCG